MFCFVGCAYGYLQYIKTKSCLLYVFILFAKKKGKPERIKSARFADFRTVREIAQGHFGVVYRAQWTLRWKARARDVVLKVFFF